MPLLELVQSTLAAINSDEVNSITDSTEAMDVAYIVKDCYYDLITSRDDWPFMFTESQLTGLGDVTAPNKMRIPTTIAGVTDIKYNKVAVTYLSPREFKDMLDNRVEQAGVISSTGLMLDRDPTYWTTYDDDYIYFDGYNSAVDTTLQQSKSWVYGTKNVTWSMTDGYVPVLPDKMFPALLAEIKAEAFTSIKQQTNQRQERKAKRGRDRWQSQARRAKVARTTYDQGVNYGR